VWENPWNQTHLKTLQHSYYKSPYFGLYAPLLDEFFVHRRDQYLADFTIDLAMAITRELGIGHTKFLRSSALRINGEKTDRLISILKVVGASHYISGPSAKDYIEEEKFQKAGITFEYMVYDYPEYPQLYQPYDPNVSILDLLFMTGPQALQYITGER
jgi:hypothetical protein